MTSPRLTLERRRALQLLSSSQHGANEELLVLGHGFSRRLLAGLGRCGLAAAEGEVVKTGEKVTVVVRIRLTAAGRRALKAMLPEM